MAASNSSAYLLTVKDSDTRDITCTRPGQVNWGICKHMVAILVRLDLKAKICRPRRGPPGPAKGWEMSSRDSTAQTAEATSTVLIGVLERLLTGSNRTFTLLEDNHRGRIFGELVLNGKFRRG